MRLFGLAESKEGEELISNFILKHKCGEEIEIHNMFLNPF